MYMEYRGIMPAGSLRRGSRGEMDHGTLKGNVYVH